MHRYSPSTPQRRRLFALNLPHQLAAAIFATIAIVACAGCVGFVYPPPAIPDLVEKHMFHAGEPIVLVTFAPGRRSGKIIGVLHSWPFPHTEAGEGFATGVFSFVGDFKITSISDDDGMPAGAEGSRKIFFHEQDPHATFADPRVYGMGEPVAVDSISLSFTFKENHRILAMRLISQQTSAQPFTFKGAKIKPPAERTGAESYEGEYSPDSGGYQLSNVNE